MKLSFGERGLAEISSAKRPCRLDFDSILYKYSVSTDATPSVGEAA
jgi:hypothetical protein